MTISTGPFIRPPHYCAQLPSYHDDDGDDDDDEGDDEDDDEDAYSHNVWGESKLNRCYKIPKMI